MRVRIGNILSNILCSDPSKHDVHIILYLFRELNRINLPLNFFKYFLKIKLFWEIVMQDSSFYWLRIKQTIPLNLKQVFFHKEIGGNQPPHSKKTNASHRPMVVIFLLTFSFFLLRVCHVKGCFRLCLIGYITDLNTTSCRNMLCVSSISFKV